MITFRGKRRGPIATLTGSDLRPKTARGSIATHALAGETRAAADAREAGMPTGADAPEQAPPPPPADPAPNLAPEDYFAQEVARGLFPKSNAHGVLIDQRAPRSGHLGVADDLDRRVVAGVEFVEKITELLSTEPGRYPRLRHSISRGDAPRIGPQAAKSSPRWGWGWILGAVQAAYERTGRVPEGRELVAALDDLEDHLPPDGETRAEARSRSVHRLQGLPSVDVHNLWNRPMPARRRAGKGGSAPGHPAAVSASAGDPGFPEEK